jgi:hypothetical protein
LDNQTELDTVPTPDSPGFDSGPIMDFSHTCDSGSATSSTQNSSSIKTTVPTDLDVDEQDKISKVLIYYKLLTLISLIKTVHNIFMQCYIHAEYSGENLLLFLYHVKE